MLPLLVTKVHGQGQDCSQAPSEMLKIMCEQLKRWDNSAREEQSKPQAPPKSVQPPGIPGQEADPMGVGIQAGAAPIPHSPYECKEFDCLCPYFKVQELSGLKIT